MAAKPFQLIGILVGAAALGGCGDTPAPPESTPALEARSSASGGGEKYQALVGRWVRPDGGYLLEVTGVDAEGRVAIGYSNPRPINVANARAVYEVDQLRLFVELRDTGYPGSTYTLLYDRENDRLGGAYYQAAVNETYDVVFVRAEQ